MGITVQFCYFVVMSSHILSLFGDEPEPEQINAVGKSRAKKQEPAKKEEKQKKEEKKEIAETKKEVKEAKKETKPPAKKKAAKAKKEEKKVKEVLVGWQPDKQYYSIGEVANLFEVATSHIRFWTNEFELKVRTTKKGDRLYTPEQVKELKVIYHLVKENGYTIAGAKARLKDAKKTPAAAVDLKQSLLQLRNKLVQIKNQVG